MPRRPSSPKANPSLIVNISDSTAEHRGVPRDTPALPVLGGGQLLALRGALRAPPCVPSPAYVRARIRTNRRGQWSQGTQARCTSCGLYPIDCGCVGRRKDLLARKDARSAASENQDGSVPPESACGRPVFLQLALRLRFARPDKSETPACSPPNPSLAKILQPEDRKLSTAAGRCCSALAPVYQRTRGHDQVRSPGRHHQSPACKN